MSTVLDEICDGVREDVAARRISDNELAEQINSAPQPRDAYAALASTGISVIAEVKRASPSKGDLATIARPADLAHQYAEGGAAVLVF